MSTSWPGLSAGQDAVYLADGQYVMAVKVSDGSLIWKYPPDKGDPARSFYASPTISDNMVIVSDYCKAGSLFAPEPTCKLLALDAQNNGREMWANPFQGGKGKWVGSPLVAGDNILAPSADGYLYVLNKNGVQQFVKKTNQSIWAQPAADKTNVYVASMDRNLYAFNLSDGTMAWPKPTPLSGAPVAGPTLGDDGILYIGTLAKEMVAVPASTGIIIGTFKSQGTIWSKPILNNGVLYFGDAQKDAGTIYALSTKDVTKEVYKSLNLNSPIYASGVKTQDGLIFVTENGDIHSVSYDLKDKILFHVDKGKLYSTPVVVGNILIVAIFQGDAAMIAIDLKDNRQAWPQPFVLPK